MDNYLDISSLIGFEDSTIPNGCIQGGGGGMATMLMKSKDLAQKTHQSYFVTNQALKDKCKRLGFKFAKTLKSQPEKIEQSVDQLGVKSIEG